VWNYMAENRDLETMSDRETILRKEDMSWICPVHWEPNKVKRVIKIFWIENLENLVRGKWFVLENTCLWQGNIHKVPITLHINPQRESHKIYDPLAWAIRLQLLRKQTSTDTFTAMTAETHRSMRTRRDVNRLTNLCLEPETSWN
jgi:hypothetical protein